MSSYFGAKGSPNPQPLKDLASARLRSEPSVIAGGHRRHALQPQRRSCTPRSTISSHSSSEYQTNSLVEQLNQPPWRMALSRAPTSPRTQQNPTSCVERRERSLKSFTTNRRSTGLIEA